jgi:hypothetical protein
MSFFLGQVTCVKFRAFHLLQCVPQVFKYTLPSGRDTAFEWRPVPAHTTRYGQAVRW